MTPKGGKTNETGKTAATKVLISLTDVPAFVIQRKRRPQ